MRALVIANPRSGAQQGSKLLQAVAAGLERRGFEVTTALTAAPGDAARLAAAASGSANLVAAVGGDGTLNEVVRGLLSATPGAPFSAAAAGALPALGFIPAGTGNGACRAFGLRRDIPGAVEAAARMRTREIDVGIARRDGALAGVFVLWLSAGHDAAFIHAFAEARKQGARLGKLALAGLGYGAVRRYGFPPLSLESDGVALTCTSAIVANVGQLPFVGNIASEARADDGRLDAVAIADRRWLGWVPLALGALTGRLSSCDGVRATTATRVRLRSDAEVPAQLDGEAAGWLPLDIEVCPRAIRLVVP